ncbi:MAG: glycosyltransferase [Pseudohongiellaceae bacterium]
MPDHDSGSVRMFSLLKIFIKLGYKVSFLPDNLQYHERYTPQMQKLGIECFYHPYTSSVTDHLQHHGHLYDLVMLSRADVAQANIKAVTELCPKARVLFDTVDLHFLREKREGELNNDKALLESALVRKQQELGIARQCDLTLVVSPVEVELFKVEAPEIPLALLSNIHRTEPTEKTFAERRDILFIANFEHPPNIDAMVFFLDEVFPLIQAENSDIGLKIVGGHPPRQLKNRAGDKVEITGFISDIKPLFNDIRLSIAPLRYGAGVKGKINSSMAYGVPVVTTTVGAEGMNLVHEQDVLIADSPEDFARQVLRAYSDESLWQKLSAAGIRNIEEHFSFQLAERQLLEILDRLETQAET